MDPNQVQDSNQAHLGQGPNQVHQVPYDQLAIFAAPNYTTARELGRIRFSLSRINEAKGYKIYLFCYFICDW